MEFNDLHEFFSWAGRVECAFPIAFAEGPNLTREQAPRLHTSIRFETRGLTDSDLNDGKTSNVEQLRIETGVAKAFAKRRQKKEFNST